MPKEYRKFEKWILCQKINQKISIKKHKGFLIFLQLMNANMKIFFVSYL